MKLQKKLKNYQNNFVYVVWGSNNSSLTFGLGYSQDKKDQKTQIVEVSCGQCQFGMKAKGCDLAVRIDDKPYFIDGTKIDEHGDAHAKDGFCSAIRKAKVVGEVKDNRFVVSYFKLLPNKE